MIQGEYGKGLYYSSSAMLIASSHAYQKPNRGPYQMCACFVNVGESAILPPNRKN